MSRVDDKRSCNRCKKEITYGGRGVIRLPRSTGDFKEPRFPLCDDCYKKRLKYLADAQNKLEDIERSYNIITKETDLDYPRPYEEVHNPQAKKRKVINE